MNLPPPQASPQPPEPSDGDSGLHPALVRDVREAIEANKRPVWPSIIVAALAVLGNGGVVAFAIGYAERVEARAVTGATAAAQAIATVQSQRGDVLAADQLALKQRLESIDAGVAKDIRRLEQKIDDHAKEQRAQIQEVLREVRKR